MASSTSSVEQPGFSIVVPTHGRPEQVADLLQSLAKARGAFAGASEIILVDSSEPAAATMISTLAQEHQARYLPADNHVPRKRNLGIVAARYDVIFFIDSDCRAEADLLTRHHHSHASAADPAIAGVLGYTEWSGQPGRVWRILDLTSSMTAAFRYAQWFKETPWGTCTNLSIRRQALQAIGGFDETLPVRVYGEDVDLGLRLGKAGYRIATNPKAVVYHDRAGLNTLRATLRKSFATGRADYHLGRRHPDRLALEFPNATIVAAALAVLGLVALFTAGRPLLLLLTLLCLLLYILISASLMLFIKSQSPLMLLSYMGVALLEVSFETGRLLESLRHAGLRRLWTKFVYVEAQLLAERERRVVQSWSLVIMLLLIFFLLEMWS
jgi:GT2 family glycosyltransferase